MPKVTMPQLGESVAEGTIGKWLKKVGDHVDKYEAIVEVITDKVNAEVPSPFEGTLTEILVQEGQTVPNHAEIAIITGAGEAEKTDERTILGSGGHGPAGSDERPVREPARADSTEPQPSRADVATAQPAVPTPPSVAAELTPPSVAVSASGNGSGAAAPPPSYEGRMTPAVRRLAREHEVDLAQIKGTGHEGRVTRDDVLKFVEARRTGASTADQAPPAAPAAPGAPATPPAPAPAPSLPAAAGQDELKAITPVRRAIAAQMVRSKQTAPHAYTTVEVDMSGVVALRESIKTQYAAREGMNLSFVPFVTKAVVEALRRQPDLNAHWTDEGLLRRRDINIGVAVAIDDGLIVPVIKNADQLSIHGLNHQIQDLASRARANRLRLEDVQGGTFTVNNTGWFGSVASQPIINVPEVAILSMEAIVKRPVVVESPAGDMIGIKPIMNVCVSFDHRATDGAQIGKFVQDVRAWLQSVDAQTPIW